MSVAYARTYTDNIEFSHMDATRTDKDFLCRLLEVAIDAGAKIVNVADTVGYAIPSEFGELISYIFERTGNIGDHILSVHCHDDLGLAVANTLAAVEQGVSQVKCTINGIGERAGNAALEEVVMALKTRNDHFDVQTRIKMEQIYKTSQLLTEITGISVQPNRLSWELMLLPMKRASIRMAYLKIRKPMNHDTPIGRHTGEPVRPREAFRPSCYPKLY